MREGPQDAQEQVRELYAKTESAVATASERMVQGEAFGELLSKVTENTMAVTRMGFDAMDLIVRNLRLAGRQDITRLGRQLARTEDKLEMVLQEVETLRAELDAARQSTGGSGSAGRRAARSRAAAGSNGTRRGSSSSGGGRSGAPGNGGARARRS